MGAKSDFGGGSTNTSILVYSYCHTAPLILAYRSTHTSILVYSYWHTALFILAYRPTHTGIQVYSYWHFYDQSVSVVLLVAGWATESREGGNA